MNRQPVSYLQTDPRWKSIPYAVAGESATIGGSGCGPTSMAMVLATWADPSVTPKSECAWALAHGYKAKGQGTYYSYFPPAAKRYGLTCWQLNAANIYGNAGSPHHAAVKQELDKGSLVIACMGKGLWTSSGHFVLVWKIDGDIIYINDPASTKPARTRGDYGLFKQQVKYYWVIQCPESEKEEPDMTEAETRKIVREEQETASAAIVQQVLAALPKETIYDTIDEVPEWARGTIQKLADAGALQGTDVGFALTLSDLRQMVINDRMGLYS